jgi:SAM-dependent methyltransferase
MTDTRTGTAGGNAALQGRLWSDRAADWADIQQYLARPSWQAVIDEQAPMAGRQVLDVGCGAGGLAELAARAGARVSGLDAAPALVEIAEQRVPDGAFRVGEMAQLPYADDSFDLVTGFNSFQYAANPVTALRESRRVARRGGAVVAMIWGTAQECEPAAYLAALGALLPPPPPGAPGPFALSQPGGLESLVSGAGLTAGERRVVSCPWEFPDEATLLRGMLSAGPAARAIAHSGEAASREAVLASCAPFRRSDGSYQLACTFHHLTCRLPLCT